MRSQYIALLASRLAGAALQALAVIIFARNATVFEVGLVGAITSIANYAGSLFSFGLAPLVSRTRAQADSGLLAALLRLNVAGTAGMIAIFSIVYWFVATQSALPLALGLIAWSIALEKNTEITLEIFIVDGNRIVPAVSVLLRRLTTIGALVLLLALQANALIAFCTALLISNAVGQLHVALLRRGMMSQSAGFRISISQALGKTLPYYISDLCGQIRTIDGIAVSAFLGVVSAGYYSAASRISNPLMLIPTTVTTLITPHATRAGVQRGREAVRRLLLATAIAYIFVIALGLAAPFLVDLLFGERFSKSASVLQALLIALPVVGASNSLAAVLAAFGHERLVTKVAIGQAVVLLILMVAFIPSLGLIGAPAAVFVSYGLSALGYVLLINKHSKSV